MKNLVRIIAIAAALGSVASAQKYIGSPAQDLFDQAAFFLETQYFGPSTINVQEIIAKYQAKVDEACSELKEKCGYDKVEPLLVQLFDDFKDDHTYYLTAANVAQENANRGGAATSPTPRIGIGLRNFCETPTGECSTDDKGNLTSKFIGDRFVSSVVKDAPADKAGIKYGDRWIGYNDVVFASFDGNLENINKSYADFTTKVRAGETIKMILLRGLNRTRIELPIKGELINTSEQPGLEIRPDGIAMITMKDFQINGVAQKLHELVREAVARGAKGIIYNERSNGGGSVLETIASVGAFIETPDLMQWTPRYNPARNTIEWGYNAGRVFARNLQKVELISLSIINPVVYKGPLAVLVDGGCASGCEYFASYIQKAKRAQVFGSPTVGIGNTNTARFGLANGGAAGMPTIQAVWSTGGNLPAQVKPDVLTENFEYKFFNTGRDEPLEKALESLGVKPAVAVSSQPIAQNFNFIPQTTVWTASQVSHLAQNNSY